MSRKPLNGATARQWNYARGLLGNPKSKAKLARSVGYSPATSQKPSDIEKSEGFNIAMSSLAAEAGNLALSVMHELKGRGFDTFANGDLVRALTAISSAFEKFTPKEKEPPLSNALRDLLLQSKATPVIDVSRETETNVIHETVDVNPFDI